MASFFGFGQNAEIQVEFKDQDKLPRIGLKRGGLYRQTQEEALDVFYCFSNFDTIAGNVFIKVSPGARIQHQGIKVELIGEVEENVDRTAKSVFTSLVREHEPAGTLESSKSFPFDFPNVNMPYESYNGLNVRLRYYLRVKITRQYAMNITKEIEFAVQNTASEPEVNDSIKMEVGIEDCLHIEFEYNKSKYNLTDVILGKIYFLLVRIKIKHMELQILRRESTGAGQNAFTETEVLTKYEIMDGAPMRGETIPIRLFLQPFNLTPTYKNVNSKFSVKYFVNLVLIDEEDRRYFKQQEIFLWRNEITPYVEGSNALQMTF